MLYEYKAKTYPYSLYGDTKVDQMPYQNDADSIADDLFEAMPKFSKLMPSIDELTDPVAIQNLPALKKKYEEDEQASLERMRRPNPLLNEDWGKSKMEIIAEAQKAKAEDERKAKLFAMLEEYQQEDAIKNQLKAVKSARDATIKKMLDNAVL